MDIQEAHEEHEQAIQYGRQWRDLDPLEERVHRRLMRIHALAGQRAEALRQYERCAALMERELDEKPGEKTERLREQIARGLSRQWQSKRHLDFFPTALGQLEFGESFLGKSSPSTERRRSRKTRTQDSSPPTPSPARR